MTSNKQDGTMELNVDQVDLLDLPLPTSDKSADDTGRIASKGPPPLPPTASAPELPLVAHEEPAKVPSLPPGPAPKPNVVSARTLVGGGTESPVKGFLVGIGIAGVVCVVLGFVLVKALHKTAPAHPPPAASSTAPTQTFKMAPIEFTAASGSAAPEPASATAATSAAPVDTAAAATTHASARASSQPTSKPLQTATATAPTPTTHGATDGVIKVEN